MNKINLLLNLFLFFILMIFWISTTNAYKLDLYNKKYRDNFNFYTSPLSWYDKQIKENISNKIDIIYNNMLNKNKNDKLKVYSQFIKFKNKVDNIIVKFYSNENTTKFSLERLQLLRDILNENIKKQEQWLFYDVDKSVVYTIDDGSLEYTYYNWIKSYFVRVNNKEQWRTYKVCKFYNKNSCSVINNVALEQSFTKEEIMLILPPYKSLSVSNDVKYLEQNKVKSIYPYWNSGRTNNKLYRTFPLFTKDFQQAEDASLIWWRDKFKDLRFDYKTKEVSKIETNNISSINDIKDLDVWYLKFETIENIINENWDFTFGIWNNSKNLASILKNIKNTVDNITKKDKTLEDKIFSIYKYIINNVEYDYDLYENYLRDKNIAIRNFQSFNWFWTFQNKKWVCSWISGLFQLMWGIVWDNNIEYIIWDYYDFDKNISIAHAWNKRWNKYYDLTFEMWSYHKQNWNYLYYWIPKEVLMIDRIEEIEKENPEIKSKFGKNKKFTENFLKNRKQIALNKFWEDYNLLYPEFIFSKYNVSEYSTIEDLYRSLPLKYEYNSPNNKIENFYKITKDNNGKEIKEKVILWEFDGYYASNFTSLYQSFYAWKSKFKSKDIVLIKNLYNNEYYMVNKLILR